LFAVAWYGDRRTESGLFYAKQGSVRAAIFYSMTLMVYLTAWSFYGSVGRAATQGYDYSAIYVGPVLVLLFGRGILRKIITVAKEQNVTSIADFIAARYGKSQAVAALVTISSVVALLPYLALQLKAVSTSWDILTDTASGAVQTIPVWRDTGLGITLFMAVFSILFGVRHIQASEHHRGLMLAIAFESTIKLLVLVVLATFVAFGLFHGIGDVVDHIRSDPALRHLAWPDLSQPSWWANMTLSAIAFLCLPHMFHVSVVESHDAEQTRVAAWLLPPYMLILTLCIVPVAAMGLLHLGRTVDPDTYMMTVPLSVGRYDLAALAFIGGFSAATGMVIVAAVALSTMACNDLVVPLLLRRLPLMALPGQDLSRVLLRIRRLSVLAILLMAYLTYRLLDRSQSLVSIGLLSFVAVAQFAPAFFIGLYWRKGSRAGAIAGLGVGLGVWFYTLFLPSLFPPHAMPDWVHGGPMGWAWLSPHALFTIADMDPVTHATLWSLSAYLAVYLVVSLLTRLQMIDRAQASAFVTIAVPPSEGRKRLNYSPLSLAELESLAAKYVGAEHAATAFCAFRAQSPVIKTGNSDAIRFTERLLAGAIGSASARVVMTASLQGDGLSLASAKALLDEASLAIQFNRDLLLATLENVSQGICVFDRDFRVATWNKRFLVLCGLPDDLVRVGMPLGDLVRFNLERGEYRSEDVQTLAFSQDVTSTRWPYKYERRRPDGTVLEICFTRMPDGGFVATYADVTERHLAAEELARANVSLEERVAERTLELARAKTEAELANLGKTRFLAAASHDLLQPLNACRLFLSALCDRLERQDQSASLHDEERDIARHAAAALQSGEQLLVTLLDISALDGKSVRPQKSDFRLDTILAPLRAEFAELARKRGLEFTCRASDAVVASDPNLLRRIVQNFLSNALRYTQTGGVLLGCRRRGGALSIEIWDTGLGIPDDKQSAIFEEFTRLSPPVEGEKGLGLGLAIVARIAAVLGHPITVRSRVGRGSVFAVTVPLGTRQTATEVLPQAQPHGDPIAGLRVLCIDNEPEILRGLRVLLTGWGCRVETSSGTDAIAAAQRLHPHAVIADYHLENGDTGLDLAERLRRHLGRPLPVLLATADRSEDVLGTARAKGVDVLYKPVRPAAMRSWLGRVARMADALPENAMPEETMPEETMPVRTMPEEAL
jgi:Na+/proline symporter/signal transduction histidine kinase/CheY-like chemotaxis protein